MVLQEQRVHRGGLQAQAEADAVLKAEGCGGRPAHGLQQGQHPREVPQPPGPHHLPGARQRHPQGGGGTAVSFVHTSGL